MKNQQRKKKLQKLRLSDATPTIMQQIQEGNSQQQIADFLNIDKSKMSRWIAKLEQKELIKTEYRSSVKFLRVAKNNIQHEGGMLIDLHDNAFSYPIRKKGVMPKTAIGYPMRGWTRYKIKKSGCIIWINKYKIQVQFTKRFLERIENNYTTNLREAQSVIAEIADKNIREFLQETKGWGVDMHLREHSKSEVGIWIKELKGVEGVRSNTYKSVYKTGKLEGKKDDMISLIERLESLDQLNEKVSLIEESLGKLVDSSIKSVEVLGKLEAILSGKVSEPNTPMKPYNSDYIG